MAEKQHFDRRGRVIALIIAGSGLGWIVANALGMALDWSQRLRAFFDLAALGGFVWAIWLIYGLWRDRQEHKD
jgi:MFS family permease